MSSMPGDTQSRHYWWLMLAVNLAHIADMASGVNGPHPPVLSTLSEAKTVLQSV